MKRIAVLASGGGSNFEALAAACARGVLAGHGQIALLVCNRADAGALERAARLGIASHLVAHTDFVDRASHERAMCAVLRAAGVELVALAGYMRILTPVFLGEVGVPVVNIHPVPTYWYQGAHGYAEAFAARAQMSSCFPTVHLVDAGVDTGAPILFGLPFCVAALDEAALCARGLREEHEVYPRALRLLLAGELEDPRVAWTAAVRAWLRAEGPRPSHDGLLAPAPR